MREEVKKAIDKMELHGIDSDFINIEISSSLNGHEWVENGVISYFVKIRICGFSDDTDEEVWSEVGSVVLKYLSAYDFYDGLENMREKADDADGDIYTAVLAITDNNGQLPCEFFNRDIIYIDTFFLKPEFRGKGVGHYVLPMIIDTVGKTAGAVAIISKPTESDGRTRIHKEDSRHSGILKQMNKFCKQAGFICVNKQENIWLKNND